MNIKKYIVGCLCLASFSLANGLPFSESQVETMIKGSSAKMEGFKTLKKNNSSKLNSFKSNDFLDLTTKSKSFSEQLDLVDSIYQGDSFINKAEAKIISKQLKAGVQLVNQPKEFLIYFYSESVPMKSTLNVLLDLSILKENGINIDSKQYMVGPPKEYKAYMNKWKATVEEYPVKFRKQAVSSFAMKLDPRFFNMYGVKKVPAMALASCKALIPSADSCQIKYLIRGDTPLVNFFDKIAMEDKKYKEYVQILNANKIYKPKDLQEVKENDKK